MKKIILKTLVLSMIGMASTAQAMIPLDDNDLSKIEGQALLNMSVQVGKSVSAIEVDPTDPSKQITTTINQSNISFYKLGLNAEMELNTNIRKLQLGCGGVNGNGCDIDIDYLSLSGISDTADGRASSSALIKNPFIELAIKNPNTASQRQVAGFRVSAESIQGLLTFGLENSETKNGINSLSGYMITADATGTVKTAAVNSGLTQTTLGKVITGIAKSSTGAIQTPFASTAYDIKLSEASGTLSLPSQIIVGSRMKTAYLKGTSVVNGIVQSGTINANASLAGLTIPISGDLSGTINNLGVNVSIAEDLGYFHKINLNGTAASLSLQSENLIWTDAKSVSKQGWWLELSNPIDIGDVTPLQKVTITNEAVAATLDQVSAFLGKTENAVNCGFLTVSCLLQGKINTGVINLQNYNSVPMSLSNLVIANQNFASNCFGGHKFC